MSNSLYDIFQNVEVVDILLEFSCTLFASFWKKIN